MPQRLTSLIAVSALTLTGIIAGVSAAHAAITEDTAAAVVDVSLANLATEPLSDELAALLVEGFVAAEEAGIIDGAITGAVSEIVDGGDQTESGAENVLESPTVEELLDQRLEGDQQRWDDIAPAWMEAFDTIRADFELCRTDGQSTSACARSLGFSLQIAHAQALLFEIDARAAELAELPDDERVTLLAALEAERAAVEARLARAEAKLAGLSGTDAESRAKNVAEVLTQVRERAAVTAGVDRAAVATTEGGAQGTSAPTDTSSRGASSGVTPQQSTPATPSQRPSQAAVPPSPQANPGQGNRPANPGNSGASSANPNGANRGNSGQ